VTAFSLGILWAAVREDLPRAADPGWNPDRPVTAVVSTSGPWRHTEHGGWTGRVEIDLLRQSTDDGPRIERVDLPAILSLPEAAAGEPPPIPGSRLRVRGYLRRNPGTFNGEPGQPGPWRLTTPSRRFVEIEQEAGVVARLSHALRERLERALEKAGDGGLSGTPRESPGAALARALVLGDPSRLRPEVVRGLRRSGLGHLLALSGLHLGLVAVLAWMGGAGLRLRRRGRLLLILLTVTVYLLIAGPRPSLLRAAVLVGTGVAALALERPPSPGNALALALLLLLAHRPTWVGDLGFQLTMAATGGVLVLAPWWSGSPRRLPEESRRRPDPPQRGRRFVLRLGRSLVVTLGAQVATLPWAVPAFHGVSPSAPWLNLLAVPWTALVLAVSFIWLAVAWAAPTVAFRLRPGLDLLAIPLGWPAQAPAGPWWFLPLDLSAVASGTLAVGLAALLGLPTRWCRRRSRRILLAVTGLALGTVAALARSETESAGVDPRLVLLDVGQGEAVLVQDGARALLVDGGGYPGGLDYGGGIGSRVLLPALLRLGVRRLDAMVLTHPDRDHCGGLVELASWLPVREVWAAPGWEGEPCADALFATPGIVRREVSAGGRGRLGSWRWRALHPELGRRRGANFDSLVLALEVRGGGAGVPVRVLLTGDVDAAGEAEILHRFRGPGRRRLRARVLKVAHHGSRSSSTLPFLAAVFGPGGSGSREAGSGGPPPLALISAGRRNPYGHPAAEVLARLDRWHARVLRTDLDGRVVVEFPPRRSGRATFMAPGRLSGWSPSRTLPP
jgi:competence protein ComEC